ncbi:hypothetical protein SLG_16320 [Sphingobium sp. SYK-6]|nr:hypothetical protein SLG_16320 [Sphingobium sp. SYK-6]
MIYILHRKRHACAARPGQQKRARKTLRFATSLLCVLKCPVLPERMLLFASLR